MTRALPRHPRRRRGVLTLTAALAAAVLAAGCAEEAVPDPADEPPDGDDDPVEPVPDAPSFEDPGVEPAPDDEGRDDHPDEARDDEPSGRDDTGSEPRLATPVRGAWVHLFDDTLKSRERVHATVATLADAGATAVVAQVARRHDAYYDSDVLPATPDPDLEPGLDVLDALTTAGAAHDVEVHAWVSIAPTEHHVYDDLPAPEGWIAREHGRDAPEAERWVSRTASGDWSDYLDPALPEVRAHTADVAAEIAERYAVDGVHLDYVRYAGPEHGYHPDALARYRDETSESGIPEPDDPEWRAWRQAQTTRLVEEAVEAVREADPEVAVSAAVIAWGAGPGSDDAPTFAETRTAHEALQPWPEWVADGLIDAVAPMVYFRDHEPEQADWFAQWDAYLTDLAAAHDTLVVPGAAGYLNSTDAAADQVAAATSAADGALVYSYQQPTSDGGDLFTVLAEHGWE